MKYKKAMMALVTIALAAGVLFSGTAVEADRESDDVRAVIEKVNKKYEEAYRNKDAAAIASIYSEDAQVFAPLRPMCEGRSEIQEAMEEQFGMGVERVKLRILEVYASGGMAYEIGQWTATGPKGIVVARGHYMTIWKKEQGQWRVFRDMASG
ncbi:MAG: nuclear transport factor 2 family protein [Candidatus Latescibacterota bacterium]|nr:MAG: nuclear transport factor 2 family protein [Candidatus Latescibacterota bacterium]